MTWGASWDGLWTLSFELSQFHGHGSWLMCEVAFRVLMFEDFAKLHVVDDAY